MSEPETIAMVEAAGLSVSPVVTQKFRSEGPFGRDIVSRTARLAVAAWALAVNGDEATLAGLAEPSVRHFMLHPAMEKWVVAPGPVVSAIDVWALEPDADPPELKLKLEFAGRQRFDDPVKPDQETLFAGLFSLVLAEGGNWPWRLTSGYIATLDGYLGYVFTSRRESPEEYYQRTAAEGNRSGRWFRIVAGFAEHDERLGASASVEVERDTPPTRYEAADLVWPAVWDLTVASLGEGDWRPSLNWVDLIELRDRDPGPRGGGTSAS